ncbi:MAG: hypothetical protein WD766_14365 [Gemmatimonadota bacterium]
MLQRALAFAALLLLVPLGADAQERLCFYDAPGLTTQTVVQGDTLITLYDPFTVTCSDGAELRANSGRINRNTREIDLVGDVFFQDSIQSLTSREATYNSATRRLFATGDVRFVNRQEGSTLEGPELEYFRATDDRPLSQVAAGQRPRLIIESRDSVADTEPLDLIADHVLIIGEDDLTATGDVVITRTDMDATAGEARYNATTEDLELRQNAVIRNPDYELGGEVIQATMVDGSLEEVRSRTRASLAGEDLRVTAPDVQLFFADDLLQRAVARIGADTLGARAWAASRTFHLTADSLDAAFVEQRLDIVNAVGGARGETIDTLETPDALANFEEFQAQADAPRDVLARDWIVGDTIVGYFVPPEADSVVLAQPDSLDAPNVPADGAAEEQPVELRRLVAVGSAQSLYRMTPEGEQAGPGIRRNVSFLVGRQIELELLQGELQVARVEGLRQGVYLEASGPAPAVVPAEPPADATPGPVDQPLPVAGGNDD